MTELRVVCNNFLVESGAEEKSSVAEALYGVRNSIFHDLRGISEKAMPLINEIVEQMGYSVPELMIKFHIPRQNE